MNLFTRLMGGSRGIETIDDYIELYNTFYNNGVGYNYGMTNGGVQQTLGGETVEPAPNNYVGLAQHAYGANGPVFSCMLVRMLVFSSIRFEWQKMLQGKPSDTWANDRQLRILQRPWLNGTTQDLLVQMIQDADLAGNSYITRSPGGGSGGGDELVRMRPDWVDILLQPRYLHGGPGERGGGQIGWRKIAFVYYEKGDRSSDAVVLLPDEVAHFSPIPDPLADYRGMSWLTPVLREIRADQSMTRHQQKFFDNGATVNLIVKYQPGMTLDKIKAFKELMEEGSAGTENAYKTLHIAPGADPVPVGANMRQIDFKSVRGAGETRIAAAAGVPPVIAGFSEGLEAATYSNYAQARRRFADGTMHPLWQNAAGSLESLLVLPDDANRLWYDAKDVPFLREDEKDAAEIQQMEATTINQLIVAGFNPETIIPAVLAGDWRLLKHSGRMSVQLIEPGQQPGQTKVTGANGGSNDNQTQ